MLLQIHKTTPVDYLVTQIDGSTAFSIETIAPQQQHQQQHQQSGQEDSRTEVCDGDGEYLGSIIWAGARPSQICIASPDVEREPRPFEMIPKGDPAAAESFEVIAGDGLYDILWVVDQNGLRAHYPYSRSVKAVPPMVAEYVPKRRRSSVAAGSGGGYEESDLMNIDQNKLPEEAMGRFWIAFVLLEVIRRSKFKLMSDEAAAPSPTANESRNKSSRWRVRSVPHKSLKDLAIGLGLQTRRWSL